jgi:hypothetical protein
VAALVWSANPDWTRDQVVAQVLGTADDIDAQNPDYAGLLGSGRVNALRALTETLPAPRVASIDGVPEDGASVLGELATITVRFDQVMDPATINDLPGFALVAAGPDGVLDTGDDVVVPVSAEEYLVGANEIVLVPDVAGLDAGLVRFEVDGDVLANPFGTALDGDEDGVPGGSWTSTFTFCPGTIVFEDTLESGAGWSVLNTAISDGAWESSPETPVGGGDRFDPPTDFDGSGTCFLTDNVDGNSDVDGGPTRLISPPIDVTAVADPYVSYARWHGSDDGDPMLVHASADDGDTWQIVELVGNRPQWEVHVFRVADAFPDGAEAVRLRFTASDNPNDSVVEGGVDRIRVLAFDCLADPSIPADVNGDAVVDLDDLVAVLAAFGPCPGPCPEDVDGDGSVGLADLIAVLDAWS